jgi:hypothetical protein
MNIKQRFVIRPLGAHMNHNKYRNYLSIMTMITIAGLSMGNQQCQETPAPPRVLKMDVEVGSLDARPVHLPSGEVIDFPYAVNTLFYRQVMNNDHFVITNPVPSPQSIASNKGVTNGAAQKTSAQLAPTIQDNISALDINILNKFGLLNKISNDAKGLIGNNLAGAAKAGIQSKATSGDESTLPSCLYDLPQASLAGAMISFEATWGAGIGVGYDANGAAISTQSVSGAVQFNQSKLELGLRTDDPLTLNTIVIADGVSKQNKVNFNIGFAGALLGLNFVFNTPLSDVIRSAMDSGLSQIVDQYKAMLSSRGSWDDAWESRVIYDPVITDGDTHIAFRGGYRAGVQVGDTFTITNLHYMWEGAACYTRLKYKVPLTTTPIAEVEVVTNGDNVSVAVVKKYLIEQKILPGAMIKILALKQAPPIVTVVQK